MDSRIFERMAMNLGLLAIGAAMAWAVALALLQDAAIAAGVFPEPGQAVRGDMLYKNPLWGAATTLQKLANVTGVVGALLLLAGAYLDRTREETEAST